MVQKDNNKNELPDNIYTANDVAGLLNGNYRTVRNILARMAKDNEVEETTVTRANRPTIAYRLSNNTIKAIKAELREIKQHKQTIANVRFAELNKNTANDNNNNNNSGTDTNENLNTINAANVKELLQLKDENNNLKNELSNLRNTVNDLKMENVKLDSENKQKDSRMLLLEDKQQSREKQYFEVKQEKENLINEIQRKNKIIILLSAVIGAIVVIGATVAVMLQLIGK